MNSTKFINYTEDKFNRYIAQLQEAIETKVAQIQNSTTCFDASKALMIETVKEYHDTIKTLQQHFICAKNRTITEANLYELVSISEEAFRYCIRVETMFHNMLNN